VREQAKEENMISKQIREQFINARSMSISLPRVALLRHTTTHICDCFWAGFRRVLGLHNTSYTTMIFVSRLILTSYVLLVRFIAKGRISATLLSNRAVSVAALAYLICNRCPTPLRTINSGNPGGDRFSIVLQIDQLDFLGRGCV